MAAKGTFASIPRPAAAVLTALTASLVLLGSGNVAAMDLHQAPQPDHGWVSPGAQGGSDAGAAELDGGSLATTGAVPDQVIVSLASGLTGSSIRLVNSLFGTKTVASLALHPTVYLLAVPRGSDVDTLVASLNASSLVEFATTNRLVSSADGAPYRKYVWSSSSEEEFERQPAAEQSGTTAEGDGSLGLGMLDLLQNPDWLIGSKTPEPVVVAILDTGMDAEHPLLTGRLHPGAYDWVALRSGTSDPADGIDNDGDGLVDEQTGHGTHVAGVVRLVAPDAKLLPMRVLDSDGQGTEFFVAAAVDHSIKQGADIVSLSLVMPYLSPVIQLVVKDAVRGGALVVAASGNAGVETPQQPAADPCVIGVAAVDPSGRLSTFANRGSWVSVVAPGENVLSAFPSGVDQGHGFAHWNGTSAATPFVAGQAARLRQARPSWKPWEISSAIGATGRPLVEDSEKAGRGLIHVLDSVDYALSRSPSRSANLLGGCKF